MATPVLAGPDVCLNMFNADHNLYNYGVAGDSCFYSVGVHAHVHFQGDSHWTWATGGDGRAHVLAAVWLRSQWTSGLGAPYNYGVEVGWYTGASWHGALQPGQNCNNVNGQNICINFQGWYEQDVNNSGLWSTPFNCGAGCEPLNQDHDMWITPDHQDPNCGGWFRAAIDVTRIQTAGCQPYSFDAVMAGVEERNSNCNCYYYGFWPQPGDASSTVTFSNLQRVDGNSGFCWGCGTNQPWGSWGNCGTAYVNPYWDPNDHTGWTDFTDAGGGYPTAFSARIEHPVNVGGSHPPNYSGTYNPNCGFSYW